MKSMSGRFVRLLLALVLVLAFGAAEAVTVSAAGTPAAAEDNSQRTLILIGDSRTYQMCRALNGEQDMPYQDAAHNAVWVSQNGARSAWVSETGLAEAEPYVNRNTDVVFLNGINDLYDNDDTVKAVSVNKTLYNSAADKLTAKGARVFAASVLPVGSSREEAGGFSFNVSNVRIKEYNQLLKVGLNKKVTYLDLYSLISDRYVIRDDGRHVHYEDDTSQLLFNCIENLLRGTHKQVLARDENGNWAMQETARIRKEYEGVQYVAGAWRMFQKGRANPAFTGIGRNAAGQWYVKNGTVSFTETGVVYDPVTKNWFYVKNSKVTPGPDVQYNAAGWWYIDKTGKVDFNRTGVEHNAAGWWRIEHGKVNFSYTGLGSNAAGTWFCRNGKVDFGYNGQFTYGGYTYTIRNGHIV